MAEAEKFVAAKAFNTVNRRIAEGEIVTREDIEAGERDFDALRKRRFIVGYDTQAANKAAVDASKAGDLIVAASPAPAPAPADGDVRAAAHPEKPPEPVLKRPSRGG